MSKLLLRKPQRTQRPAGNISGINLTPDLPISVSSLAADGTIITTLAAVGAVGGVTYTCSLNTKVRISGANLVVNTAGGALTAGSSQTVQLTATDSRGAGSAGSRTITFSVFTVPTQVTLVGAPGATGTNGTVVDSDPAGTLIGVYRFFDGVSPIVASSHTNSKFTNGTDPSGLQTLVRSGTGTVVAGVGETDTVHFTDAQGATVNIVFNISIGNTPVIGDGLTRFDPKPLETNVIVLVFNPAYGDPLAVPTITTAPNTTVATGIWCTEGLANSWTTYSTTCPSVDGAQHNTIDDARIYAKAHGYNNYRFRFGTAAHKYDLKDFLLGSTSYSMQVNSITQSNNALPEFIDIEGLGYIDMGNGPTGVKQWDLPRLQLKHMIGGNGAQNHCLLDLRNDDSCQSEYRIDGVRWGPFREDEAATKKIAYNIQGATDIAGCTLPARSQQGWGIALIETAKRVSITHSESVGSFSHGIHSSPGLTAATYNLLVQMQDCRVYGGGQDNNDHNIYLGGLRNGVFGNCFLTQPIGHQLKIDNSQAVDAYENSLNGLHPGFKRYIRTNAKVFTGEGVFLEAPKRKIPLTPPYDIKLYSWYGDTANGTFNAYIAGTKLVVTKMLSGILYIGQTISGPGVLPGTTITAFQTGSGYGGNYTVSPSQIVGSAVGPVVVGMTADGLAPYVPYYDVTGDPARTPFTIITAGTPGPGQLLKTESGSRTTDKNSNSGIVIYTANVADAGKDIRLPGIGCSVSRLTLEGASVSVDNPNLDFRFWNNMIHSMAGANGFAGGDILIQGRFQGADIGHHKLPAISRQSPTFPQVRKMETVLGGVLPAGTVGPPHLYTGWIGAAVTSTLVLLNSADYAFPSATVTSHQAGPFFVAGDGVVYDIQIRMDNGQIHTTTCTFTSVVNAGQLSWNITLAAMPPSTVSGNADRRNACRLKLPSEAWDRPRMDTAQQRPWCDRTDPDYWFYAVTFSTNRTELDFSKQEPDGTRSYPAGIPFSYIFANFHIPLSGVDSITSLASVNNCIVKSYNTTFCTQMARGSLDTDYQMRMPFPPLRSSDGGVSWPVDLQAGAFDWDLHITTVAQGGNGFYYIDGTGGVGIKGSDFIRPNAAVIEECLIFDIHMAATGKYEALAKVNANTAKETLYNTDDVLADLRFIPNLSGAVDLNGCIKITSAQTTSFPPLYDRGKPLACLTGINVSDMTHNTVRVRTLAGGTPAVNDLLHLECDNQWDVGEGMWAAYATSVTPVNATDFDIVFDPPLPTPGSTHWLFGTTIPTGHELGLSVFTSSSAKGGRAAFAKPARRPRPSWWILPTNILSNY